MPTGYRRHLLHYGVAVAIVFLAVGLKWLLDPLIRDESPFLLFFAAVMVSAWYGGLRPGLVTTLFSALAADYFFLPPTTVFSPTLGGFGHQLVIALFLLEGGVISWLTDSLRTARRKADALTRAKEETLFRERAAYSAIAAAEEAFREGEDRLRFALQAANMGTWEWDIATGRIAWSSSLEAVHGLQPGTFGGTYEDFLRDVHPEDRERLTRSIAQTLEDCGTYHVEYRIVPPDGSIRWVEARARVVCDASNRPLRMTGVCMDVTERKQSEETLRESEAHFRRLADAIPQMVWVARPDGHVEYVNRRWIDYTALPLEESSDRKTFAQIVHPDDCAAAFGRYDEAFARGSVYQQELRLQRASDRSYRWFLGRSVPIRNERGLIERWFGTYTDIDDQKRAEEALKEIDRRKDEFLAMLSHELRNPMAPIRNAVHILRLSDLDDPSHSDARDIIDRQVQQLSGIVDDLLDVFRITNHKIALRRESLDLAHLVRRTAEDHRSALEGMRLTLILDLPDDPVWVVGDSRRLVQVLSNLLHNAAKFTNAGDQVSVYLAVDPRAKRATVMVRDTGIGIPREELPLVFDTFAQGDKSLDRSRGGLGLGLAMVKGIVELHGGTVHASSPGPGRGTEISLGLPLDPRPPATPNTPHVLPAARPLRILIVEDNRDTARTLRTLLMRYGHEVNMTHSGTAGVEMARQCRPDVVLCDLGLPGMDGYEVASELRHDPDMAAVRLIAVSGYGQEEDRRRSEAAGFDLHLTKPVDPVELQRLLAVINVGT